MAVSFTFLVLFRIFGPLREEKIKMDPRCNTAVVGEPGFERQPLHSWDFSELTYDLDDKRLEHKQ